MGIGGLKLKICFFGTPEFALPSLSALIDNGYDIAAVVTQPDRPKNRGGKMTQPPVKTLAQKHGIKVLQYDKIRTQGVDDLKSLGADIFVTAAYGQILSEEILRIPSLGCINVHGSLLPKYRGPAPIQWCIINGESTTGITTMYTDIGVDTGDMILKEETPILPEETAEELYARLSVMGGGVLVDTLELIKEGKAPRTPQNEAEASHYPMLKKQHGRIDFTKTSVQIKNLVRGVNPWPGAYGSIDGSVIKIWKVAIAPDMPGEAGQIFISPKQGIAVKTGDGCIAIEELQIAGSKRLTAVDFLRGRKLPGDRFDV
jgi:methionyl-tRNA formyltransferase